MIRVEFDPPPIPTRQCDWHAWVEGDEESGTFHAPTEKEALMALCEALAERYFDRPGTTRCECGAIKQV